MPEVGRRRFIGGALVFRFPPASVTRLRLAV